MFSIIIKPDMTPQNQHKEALLLKERWALIKSGVDKADIKTKSSSLYVKGTKHGYVLNSVFNRTSDSPSILNIDTSSTNQNILADPNTPNLQSNSKTTPQTKSQDLLGSSSNVSAFYCNARSLCNKLYIFQGYIYASSFDIICVTETWLNSDIADNEVLPKGYNIYRRDRGHRGGGVLLAINSRIPCKRVDVPVDIEAVTIQLSFLYLFLYVFYTFHHSLVMSIIKSILIIYLTSVINICL